MIQKAGGKIMERRQIEVYKWFGVDYFNQYQVLKQSRFSDNGQFEKFGSKYNIKGLFNLLSNSCRDASFEFKDNRIEEEIRKYAEELRKRKERQKNKEYSRML